MKHEYQNKSPKARGNLALRPDDDCPKQEERHWEVVTIFIAAASALVPRLIAKNTTSEIFLYVVCGSLLMVSVYNQHEWQKLWQKRLRLNHLLANAPNQQVAEAILKQEDPAMHEQPTAGGIGKALRAVAIAVACAWAFLREWQFRTHH